MRFTVRRPASAEVSPCCDRPSGGDVACSVHIGIARPRTAGDAPKDRLALAVFRRHMPAVRASLRSKRCRDEFQPPRGFVLQAGHQQSPALAADLTVKAAFLRDAGARAFSSAARRAGHCAHLQVLDTDGVVAARQIGGGLFHPVTAAICFTSTHPRDGQPGSCAPLRSALCPSQTLLQPAQPLSFTGTKTRNRQQLPARQRHRDRHSAIHTHHAAIAGPRNGVRDHSKSDVPAPRAIQGDSVGLHGVCDGAGPAEAHPADLGYPYLPVAVVEPFDVARFDSDLTESLVFAGLAPRRATVGAVQKAANRLGEVPQRLLLHSLRPGRQPVAFCAGRRQLGTLLVIPGRVATRLPVLVLLDGQIPHKPGMATMLGQYRSLLKTRKQPKPGHINNLGITTDNLPKGGQRRFRPWLNPGVSTPQN